MSQELEEIDDELRLTRKALTQLRVLCGYPHWAGVEMTNAHENAPRHNERCGGKTILFSTKQRTHDDIATGLHLAIYLNNNSITHAVEHECLLSLCQADLPGSTGVLERIQRARPCAAIVAGDKNDVGFCLRDTSSNCANAFLTHELDVDSSRRVGPLEVENKLLEVFDRIDIVMRRRRDEPHTGRAVARPCNPWIYLACRQLATLTRLGSLSHLDLDVVCMSQVHACYAKTARGNLFDGAASRGIE